MDDIKEPTIITVQSYDTTVKFELPYSDATIKELLHGFFTCLVGITFTPRQIYDGMKDYIDEYSDEIS